MKVKAQRNAYIMAYAYRGCLATGLNFGQHLSHFSCFWQQNNMHVCYFVHSLMYFSHKCNILLIHVETIFEMKRAAIYLVVMCWNFTEVTGQAIGEIAEPSDFVLFLWSCTRYLISNVCS